MSITSSADAAAVVVAAGSGRRMGGLRKQYLALEGEPVLARALRPFREHRAIGTVVVVLPPDDVDDPPDWLRGPDLVRVAGGAERGDSVRSGLAAVPEAARVVLIHDGARPLLPTAVLDRVLAAARTGPVIAALPLADTLKRVDEQGRVVETVPRAALWRAQTPQGFPLDQIRAVHDRARQDGLAATDDAALCEHYGIDVRVVEGAETNLKITRPADLQLAAALLRARPGG